MANLKEKIGYGFGDMASSMFWKVFSYYLPFFYANVFGISLVDTGVLLLVTRIWEGYHDHGSLPARLKRHAGAGKQRAQRLPREKGNELPWQTLKKK